MSRLASWLGGLCLGPLALLIAGGAATAGQISPVEGVWLTNDQTELTIVRCSSGYCGYISKIVVPDRVKAQYGNDLGKVDPAAFTDVNNENPALRGRPIQGLRILALRATGTPGYFEGEIYNPENGKVYAGSVEVLGANAIRLKGCVLYVLCQDQQWARLGPAPARAD